MSNKEKIQGKIEVNRKLCGRNYYSFYLHGVYPEYAVGMMCSPNCGKRLLNQLRSPPLGKDEPIVKVQGNWAGATVLNKDKHVQRFDRIFVFDEFEVVWEGRYEQ